MTTKVSWKCEECNFELGPDEMLEHLYEVHKLERNKVITTKKRPIVFGDGPGYYMQQWEWIIEGKSFIQTIEVEGVQTSFKDLDVL